MPHVHCSFDLGLELGFLSLVQHRQLTVWVSYLLLRCFTHSRETQLIVTIVVEKTADWRLSQLSYNIHWLFQTDFILSSGYLGWGSFIMIPVKAQATLVRLSRSSINIAKRTVREPPRTVISAVCQKRSFISIVNPGENHGSYFFLFNTVHVSRILASSWSMLIT